MNKEKYVEIVKNETFSNLYRTDTVYTLGFGTTSIDDLKYNDLVTIRDTLDKYLNKNLPKKRN